MNFFQGDQIFLGVMEKTLGGAPSPTYGKNIGFPWGGTPLCTPMLEVRPIVLSFDLWVQKNGEWHEKSYVMKSPVMKSPVMKSPIVMKVSGMKCPSYERSCDEMS